MTVITQSISLKTKGNGDMLDITSDVQRAISREDIKSGLINIFIPGSTGALTTIEYEDGLIEDFFRQMERIAPCKDKYLHHLRWGDDNGHSHIRASFIGPSLTVPFTEKKLFLGTWQQIVFIDFDTRPRSRELILQIIGE